MEENRKKTRQVKFRLTEKEYEKFYRRLEKSNMSQQDYLTACVLNKKIIIIEGFKDVVIQLKRMGVNLNQLTKKANEGFPVDVFELKGIEKGLIEIWQLLKQLSHTGGLKR